MNRIKSKKSRTHVYIGDDSLHWILLKIADIENIIGHLAMRIIIGVFVEVLLEKTKYLDEQKNFELLTKATELFFKKEHFQKLKNNDMLNCLNFETKYWRDDWANKYTEIFNMADAFLDKKQNKYNEKIMKHKEPNEFFTQCEKLALFWMYSSKNAKKYSISRKKPLVAMSSTYLAQFLTPSSCDIPITIRKLFIYKQLFSGTKAHLHKEIKGVTYYINEILIENDYVWIFWKDSLSRTKFKQYTLEFEQKTKELFFELEKLPEDSTKFFDFHWREKLILGLDSKDLKISKTELDKVDDDDILQSYKPVATEKTEKSNKTSNSNFKIEKKNLKQEQLLE